MQGTDITEDIGETPVTRFSDVKGVDEARAELQDIVSFLRDPDKYQRIGAKVGLCMVPRLAVCCCTQLPSSHS
jgi:ATP-dependent Zn protease